MATPRSDTAAKRAKRWNLHVKHALYRKTGDWYHQLERFPGALLDEEGYVVFETEQAYRSCPQLRIRKDVGVPNGIVTIPGYTRVAADAERESAAMPTPTSYEKAMFREGATTDVVQTRRERDPAARASCIREHGCACSVCGFDFALRYGPIGAGFTHVHHLTPLAEGERDVDPIADLRPICPNCHAMVHRRNPSMSLEELRGLLTETLPNKALHRTAADGRRRTPVR